jgi:hypothetical protein
MRRREKRTFAAGIGVLDRLGSILGLTFCRIIRGSV